MRAELFENAADLARIAPAWQDLFERVPEAPPFTAPAWLIPWWATFEPGRLATVAVWDGETLVGLAPTYIEDGEFGTRLLPLGIGISDHMDVLVDPNVGAACARALAGAIGAMRSAWRCWSAEDAAPGASVLSLPDPEGCRSTIEDQSVSPVLTLPEGDAATLEAAIPAGKRRKWRMAQNRVGRREWRLASSDRNSLGEDLEHLFRLHGARWESRGEAGVLRDDQVRTFHRAAAPGLLACGLLRLWTLSIDGTVAGVYFGFGRRQRAYAYLGGFDPAFAYESPGTLLMGAAITAAQAEGATAFHFLRGQEAYKYEWGARDMWTCRRTVVPA